MSRVTTCLVLVLLLALEPSPSAPVAGADSEPQAEFTTRELRPFLESYCLKCHGGEKPKGGLTLTSWRDAKDLMAQPVQLSAVIQRLKDGSMPPEGKPQPPGPERAKIVAALQQIQAKAKASPGRVTVRRLNRTEYNNTVRDLLGIDFHPADDFPGDEVGYGFDHIGDVLALSPLLLEKYLKAAERITREGLTPPQPIKPAVRRVLPREFRAEPPGMRLGRDGRFRMLEAGELRAALDAPLAGKYRLKVQAMSEPAGDEKARFSVLLDGKPLGTHVVAQEQGQRFQHEVDLTAGKHSMQVVFENPFKAPPPGGAVRRLGIAFVEIEGPHGLPPPTPPAAYQRLFAHRPGAGLPPREAARRIITPLAERAYRRPVQAVEIEKLLRLFDQSQADQEPFEESVRFMVQGLLLSPHFLFRIEGDADAAGPDREALGSFALASRLSYFLWSSMPDDELFKLARANRLQETGVLAEQVQRMLRDPKASALTDNFAGQWLQLRSLAVLSPDPGRFPEFDDELRQALARETELFFQHMLTEGRPLAEFLTADYTFLNERLARHYGIPDVRGPEFRLVRLSTEQRGGLLTQGSILTVTSNPTRTSPVKRGKWILENLLAAPPPPPPPGVGDLAEDDKAVLTGSLRQRMELHRRDPTCATCHARLDPLGFALENYDAIGRWRTQDGKFKIDPAGSLPDGQTFKNAADLRVVLAGRLEDFRRCVAEKLLTYALGRGLEAADRPHVLRVAEAGRQRGDRLVDLIVAVVQAEPFRFRQVEKR